MKNRYFPFVAMLLLFFVAAFPAFAETITARGVEVVDGDTVAIRVDGKRQRVRMVDYDAPNIGRFAACPAEAAAGAKAKARLRSLVNLRTVTLQFTGDVDPYSRRLAYLRVGKTSVGELLARRGLAVPYAGHGEHHWPRALCSSNPT